MIPIYEQGDGRGIGHSLDTFLTRFDAICEQHLNDRRARAFAFIFYDFSDAALRQILHDQGVFAQLDRLAGRNLSLFYLHTGSQQAVMKFNTVFLLKLGVEGSAQPPCVVFFKIARDEINDLRVIQLDHTNLIHGFHELYGVIEAYIKEDLRAEYRPPSTLLWLKNSSKFIALEVFRAALKKALSVVM